MLPVGISCCKSSNIYSISSCGKRPKLVCSCYSSNVFPRKSQYSKMAVGRDALGKTAVKLLHHEKGSWMHHTRHSLPLQCRKSKGSWERNPGKAGEHEHAVCSLQLSRHMIYSYWSQNPSVTYCCHLRPPARATAFQCGLHSFCAHNTTFSVQVRDGSRSEWHLSGFWGLVLTFHFTGICLVCCTVRIRD